jgi:hypothetical protein
LGISPAAYRRRFSTATTGRIETERRFIYRRAAEDAEVTQRGGAATK